MSKSLNNSQPPGIFLNPPENCTHTLKISQPPQYFLTLPPPRKKSQPLQNIISTLLKKFNPSEKISTPPKKSQPLPKKCQPLQKKCQLGLPNNSQPHPKNLNPAPQKFLNPPPRKFLNPLRKFLNPSRNFLNPPKIFQPPLKISQLQSKKYQPQKCVKCVKMFLNKLQANPHKSFICGDFNINLLKINDSENYNAFFRKCDINWFFPQITMPTRLSDNSNTLIDNIFTNNICKPHESGILVTPISDHLMQFCILKRKL